MRKKILIIAIILITIALISALIKINKKEETKDRENKTILLETEEGNIKTNNFPSKEEYEYDKIDCTNLNSNTNVTPSFNSETWKLNLTATSTEKLDGDFQCKIYFKEIKEEKGTDTIIDKYEPSNSEGLIKIDQPATSQTPELTEYRYTGKTPKNYVTFNDEVWRIIGVFEVDDGTGTYEERIKIIRNESIGNYSWDTTA